MFGMGMGELIVIVIVALLFVGPDKLPGVAKTVGKGIRELRKHTRDLQDTIEQDETIGGTVRELRSALRGEDYEDATRRIRPPVHAPTPIAAASAAPADVPPDQPTGGPAPTPPQAVSGETSATSATPDAPGTSPDATSPSPDPDSPPKSGTGNG